jgi:hypothetical protein
MNMIVYHDVTVRAGHARESGGRRKALKEEQWRRRELERRSQGFEAREGKSHEREEEEMGSQQL